MAKQTGLEAAISKAGSEAELARLLSRELGKPVSYQTVNNWKRRGVPVHRCKPLERLTGVSVKRLRPNDWRDYWPEPAMSA